MNNLLIFFALPIATIVFSIALQKIFSNPVLVTAIIFAAFLIVTAVIGNLQFLIATIVYSIIAFIVAFIVMLIRNRMCNSCCNNSNNNQIRYRRRF